MIVEDIQLDREDIVLLLLEANERLLRKPSLNGITRLEKLLFLLETEGDFEGVGRFFSFVPHNFGPFSKEVYEAVEFLASCGLISVKEKSYVSPYASSDESRLLSELSEDESGEDGGEVGITEKQFALTDDGRKVADIMRRAVAKKRIQDIESLDDVVLRFGARPLSHLIRYVYRQHPAMTVKSIHPEARNVR